MTRSLGCNALFLLALFWLGSTESAAARASEGDSIPAPVLYSVQVGPNGELLVSGAGGISLSYDWGDHWTAFADTTEGIYQEHAARLRTVEQLIQDQGVPWAKLPTFPRPVRDSKGRLYRCSAKTYAVVEVSLDGGQQWRPGKPLGPAIGTEEQSPGREYACPEVVVLENVPYVLTLKALFLSANGGKTWLKRPFDWERDDSIPSGFRLFGDRKGNLFVNRERWAGSISRSADGGNTWSEITFGMPKKSPYSVAGDSMGLLEVYGDRYYFYYQAYANSGEVEILVSLDGKTSTRVMGNVSVRGTGGPRYGGFDVGPHGELAILSDEVLFLSRDDGQTWKRVRLDPLLKAN